MNSEKLINNVGGKVISRLEDAVRSESVGNEAAKVIAELEQVPGITPASSRDLKASTNLFTLRDGTVVSRFVNPVGVHHVFLSSTTGKFIYGGFVGWIHTKGLKQKLDDIREKYSDI